MVVLGGRAFFYEVALYGTICSDRRMGGAKGLGSVPKMYSKSMWNRHLHTPCQRERDFFVDNLVVRIHLIIEMIRWTGLAPWEKEIGILLPNNQPQHRTLHIQKDVPLYALC